MLIIIIIIIIIIVAIVLSVFVVHKIEHSCSETRNWCENGSRSRKEWPIQVDGKYVPI